MNEIEFIQKLKKVPASSQRVIIGIGDDAALVDDGVIITTDTLVEGNHFSREYFSPQQIGQKAVEVNVSDVVVMGGKPTFMVVAIASPKAISQDYLLKVYEGIKQAAKKHDIALVGGDLTSSSKELVITITLLGKVEKSQVMISSGAKAGDVICVTGELGGSAAGLAVLKERVKVIKPVRERVIKKHIMPTAKVKTADFLAKLRKVQAITDISDGIASDMRKILGESRVGAVLDFSKIPVSTDVKEVMKALGKPFWHAAIYGGEDFEFIFTASAVDYPIIQRKAVEARVKISAIGEIISDKKGRVYQKLSSGITELFKDVGYNQFGENAYSY